MFIITALALGFLGSFHCIGMCGPIALAIPTSGNGRFHYIRSSAVYNSGRIITYSLIGLVAGIIGHSIAFAGFQDTFSIIMGSIILLTLLLPQVFKFSGIKNSITAATGKLKSALRQHFSRHSLRSILLIGLLNGLLPCGLVYLGVAGSLTAGSTVNGILFMVAFGAGTFPAMMSVAFFRDRITASTRNQILRLMPYFISLMAILLILRGLHLGIPYISPAADPLTGASCCHPH